MTPERIDVVVIGAGPAGQKAAIQAAKAGRSVVIVDQGTGVGGECVHRGTIPSKTLRETAAYLSGLEARSEGVLRPEIGADVKVESLMRRQHAVAKAHQRIVGHQLERNGIRVRRGRARFTSPHIVEVQALDGTRRSIHGEVFVLATGSRPRVPDNVPVDHEHILDSDSILSLIYLPRTLIVLGAGVIACEFASLFAALGVRVTMVDKGERPLAFLDPDLTDVFLEGFERGGNRFLGSRGLAGVQVDGVGAVAVTLEDGETIRAEKVFCALGRVAMVKGLGLEAAGIALGPRGTIEVDAHYRTAVPHIYAAGDVIGPPALAAVSMEQGRRAARHALGLPAEAVPPVVPVGIYTIPEMASVGVTEAEAKKAHGDILVGRARFEELARGQINGGTLGLLKLVARAADGRLLGAHVVGEGATELVHVAQMALIAGASTDLFIDHVFNFPTLAESYRVAALDVAGQAAHRAALRAA